MLWLYYTNFPPFIFDLLPVCAIILFFPHRCQPVSVFWPQRGVQFVGFIGPPGCCGCDVFGFQPTGVSVEAAPRHTEQHHHHHRWVVFVIWCFHCFCFFVCLWWKRAVLWDIWDEITRLLLYFLIYPLFYHSLYISCPFYYYRPFCEFCPAADGGVDRSLWRHPATQAQLLPQLGAQVLLFCLCLCVVFFVVSMVCTGCNFAVFHFIWLFSI